MWTDEATGSSAEAAGIFFLIERFSVAVPKRKYQEICDCSEHKATSEKT